MVLARDWAIANADPTPHPTIVRDTPIDAAVLGVAVHIHAEPDVNVTLTPAAALEIAKRIGDAAIEVLIETGDSNAGVAGARIASRSI